MMNLSDHFMENQCFFVSTEELASWCEAHGIVSNRAKQNLILALEAIGAKKGFIKWNGMGKHKRGFCYVTLKDFSLWRDKEFWGKGCTIWEENW